MCALQCLLTSHALQIEYESVLGACPVKALVQAACPVKTLVQAACPVKALVQDACLVKALAQAAFPTQRRRCQGRWAGSNQ